MSVASDGFEQLPQGNTHRTRGFKRCQYCFSRMHVKLKTCRNCDGEFPRRIKKKCDYDPCELRIGSIKIRLFSINRTLHGILSRNFVYMNVDTSKWYCFNCDGADTPTTNNECYHIDFCKKCTMFSDTVNINEKSIEVITTDRKIIHEVKKRIEHKTSKNIPVIFRTSNMTFAVSSLLEDCASKFETDHYVGYVHTRFVENIRAQNKLFAKPTIRFACECKVFKYTSKANVNNRKGEPRCIHYYLTMTAIHSNPEIYELFITFDMKIGVDQNESVLNLLTKRDPKERVVINVNDWITSLVTRINNSLHPANCQRAVTLRLFISECFMLALRVRLDNIADVKSKPLEKHPTIYLTSPGIVEHKWTVISLKQLRQLLGGVERVRYFEIVNNEFEFRTKDMLDMSKMSDRLVRTMIDFEEPFTFTWVDVPAQHDLQADELVISFAIRRDLYT